MSEQNQLIKTEKTMTKIEQTIAAIRAANPSLMELGFGSRIKLDTTGKETTYICNANESFWIKSDETESPTQLSRWGTGYFIIGKEPELQHLLKAIAGTHADGWVLNYHTNMYGQFVFRPDDKFMDYDLTKSLTQNLTDNPELLDWLHNRLVTKS